MIHVFHDYIRFYEVLKIEEALEKTLKFCRNQIEKNVLTVLKHSIAVNTFYSDFLNSSISSSETFVNLKFILFVK
jgi:hypothetical protein